MSKKAGELDWSELLNKSEEEYKHKPTALWAAQISSGKAYGIDPLSKAKPRIKEDEIPYKPTNEEIAKAVLYNVPKQPTDEELFGHLVVTEEMVKKAEEEWNNRSNNAFNAMKAPITSKQDQNHEWANGKSFNDSLTREELEARNMFTDTDE